MIRSGERLVPRQVAAEEYWRLIERRSPSERRTLALVKRFIERYVADRQFRERLADNRSAPERVTAAYGIHIDPRLARPLFDPEGAELRRSDAAGDRWPLARVWDDYVADVAEWRGLYLRNGDCADVNPRFHAWRIRHIRRAGNELGPIAERIQHPVLAFELSEGCSVGCWFCGVSAAKFSGAFPYTDRNARLWRGVLERTVEIFGAAAQAGFCYWATDPTDNPDYLEFIEDYYTITGALPQTTTARPLRDLDFTRRMLRLSERCRGLPNRFSILTSRALGAVHEAFSADDLLHVELVPQNREALTVKAIAGRARERLHTVGSGAAAARLGLDPAQTTIACVTGLLVNMVSRSIRLITPVRASDRWPLGYRVYGERHFATAEDFGAGVEELIATNVSNGMRSGDLLRFRDDVVYIARPHGFELRTANTRFVLDGFEGARRLGDLVHAGGSIAGEICDSLVRSGADIFAITGAVQQLFDQGLLGEDPPDPSR